MKDLIAPTLGAVIGTFIAWLLMPVAGNVFDLMVPASRWLEVERVQVENASVGESPQVRVSRTIHRPFAAQWTVTLRRETGEGYASFCTRHGRNDYRADAIVPAGTDLDWWMDIPVNPPCPAMPAGLYVMTITWTMDLPGLHPKIVRAQSNVFEINS